MQSALRGKRLETGKVTRLVAQYLGDMTEDVDGVLASIVETVIQRSIASHCVNVALLAMGIGIEMGLDATNVRNLGLAALVHDWGMAGVAPEIAEANRRLTEDEFYEIKKHPITSLRLLEKLPKVPSVVPLIVYQVHERPNGNGYPRGRTGERIHPLAKIISVADAYQALISPRPFRPPLMRYAAMECILRQARTGDLDAEVVRALLMVQSLFPIGSYVSLSDGSVARVLRRNGDKYRRPIVLMLENREGVLVPRGGNAGIVDLDQAGLERREGATHSRQPGDHAQSGSHGAAAVARRQSRPEFDLLRLYQRTVCLPEAGPAAFSRGNCPESGAIHREAEEAGRICTRFRGPHLEAR